MQTLTGFHIHPRHRIRLAVDIKFQKQGVGSILLIDAIRRSLYAEIANYTMLVDAQNKSAVDFYKRHGFMSLTSSHNILFLPLETAKNLI